MASSGDYSNNMFKLLEASHFLDQVKNTQHDDIKAFLFNLSAHLTALVSVIDVMKYEFNSPKKQDFEDWFRPECVKLESAGFDEFTRLRKGVVHLAGNLAKKLRTHDNRRIE